MMSNLAGLSAFKFVIVCSQKEQIVCATSESETSTEVSVMSIVTSSKAMETRALSNDSACSDWMHWLCDYRAIICKSALLDTT